MGSTLNAFPDSTAVACKFSLLECWVTGGMSPKITAPVLAKTYGGHWRWRTHSFAGLVVKMSTGRRAGADTDCHKGRFATSHN